MARRLLLVSRIFPAAAEMISANPVDSVIGIWYPLLRMEVGILEVGRVEMRTGNYSGVSR